MADVLGDSTSPNDIMLGRITDRVAQEFDV